MTGPAGQSPSAGQEPAGQQPATPPAPPVPLPAATALPAEPLPAGRFVVEVAGIGAVRGVRSVSALSVNATTGQPAVVTIARAPGLDRLFHDWATATIAAVRGGGSPDAARHGVAVTLLDPAGAPALRVVLAGCLPVAWSALGPLDADAGGLALETLTVQPQALDLG